MEDCHVLLIHHSLSGGALTLPLLKKQQEGSLFLISHSAAILSPLFYLSTPFVGKEILNIVRAITRR